jgi:hypothetical protein
MLPINFDFLASENPELEPAAIRLGEWANKHRTWGLIDPRAVSREIRDVDPFLLSFALHQLVVKGLFRQVYMVTTPTGALAEGEYDDPNNIPARLATGFEEYFDRDDGVIISVLKPVQR